MKKFSVPASILAYFTVARSVLAQDNSITIDRPKINNAPVGYSDISEFIRNAMTLIFIIATIIVLVMLVWGAIEWIMSGSTKDGVENARKKIIQALVGFAILAVAFAIAKVAGQFLGFDITGTFTIPSPTQ